MAKAHADTESAGNGVQVISRVAQLLRALDAEPWGLTLTELAVRLGLPRSTVHRLVGSLVTEELLTPADTVGRFRIGPEIMRIASANRVDLRDRVEPYMREVFDAIDETVDCSVLDGTEARVVHVIPTGHALRVVAEVGATFPLHATAKGKSLLALLDDETICDILPRAFERYTPNTTTTRDGLLREVDTIRNAGIAFDEEEHHEGICAAAIASRDITGSRFTISVPTPSLRWHKERDLIIDSLQRIREQLGAQV